MSEYPIIHASLISDLVLILDVTRPTMHTGGVASDSNSSKPLYRGNLSGPGANLAPTTAVRWPPLPHKILWV